MERERERERERESLAMIGEGIMTKYAIKYTAKHVLRMSPERASRLGNVCKWVVGIATLDMGV